MAANEAAIAGPEADHWAVWEGPSHDHQRGSGGFCVPAALGPTYAALWALWQGSQPFIPAG